MPKLTGVEFDRWASKTTRTVVTIELSAFDLCSTQSFITIEAFAVLRPKLWPKRWQVPTLTGVNIDRRQKLQKTIATIEFIALDLCRVRNFIKIEAFVVFRQNYGLKDDRCQHGQVSRITENYCHQWIPHFQIAHSGKFLEKWLTSFPVPRSPF